MEKLINSQPLCGVPWTLTKCIGDARQEAGSEMSTKKTQSNGRRAVMHNWVMEKSDL